MKINFLNHQQNKQKLFNLLLITGLSSSLLGCGSGSDDSGTGYIQLYNLSSNSPEIYLTLDQEDNDDFDEKTHSAIEFTNISSRLTYDKDTYDIELAWENEYDNTYDLEVSMKVN